MTTVQECTTHDRQIGGGEEAMELWNGQGLGGAQSHWNSVRFSRPICLSAYTGRTSNFVWKVNRLGNSADRPGIRNHQSQRKDWRKNFLLTTLLTVEVERCLCNKKLAKTEAGNVTISTGNSRHASKMKFAVPISMDETISTDETIPTNDPWLVGWARDL